LYDEQKVKLIIERNGFDMLEVIRTEF